VLGFHVFVSVGNEKCGIGCQRKVKGNRKWSINDLKTGGEVRRHRSSSVFCWVSRHQVSIFTTGQQDEKTTFTSRISKSDKGGGRSGSGKAKAYKWACVTPIAKS